MSKAARWASQLGPGSAIRRTDDADSQVFTIEASLLRMWINMNLEDKHRIKTVEEAQKQQHQLDKRQALAERLLRDQRRAVTDG